MENDQWAPAATPSTTPSPVTAPGTATATGMPTATEDQKGLAAVAYILTWVTGLIIFFVAKKEQRYARWNAVQSIGIGIIATALSIVLNVVQTAMWYSPMFMLFSLLSAAIWIGILIVVVLTAIKAYQGTPMRLPVLADFADKYA